MTVKEKVIEYLKKNGYDGLYYDNECGCELKDLMSCNSEIEQCEPGYMQISLEEENEIIIGPKKSDDYLDTTKNKICSRCKKPVNPSDSRWRCAGSYWEHKCGDAQSGYFMAIEKEE